MTDSIRELQNAVIRFRDDRDWKQFNQLKDLVQGLQIEAAELAELLLWKTPEEADSLAQDEETRARLAEEMADVLIFLLYLAEETGIPLADAVRDKLVENGRKYPVEKARGSRKKWTELESDQATTSLEKEPRSGVETGQFERVIAVDWSGAMQAARRKIWVCDVVGGRVQSLTNGRSRDEVADYLIEESKRDPRFVVGFDFAFSLPGWFLRKQGYAEVEALWDDSIERGERWLEDCPSPFWGRNGRKKPDLGEALYRATDLASKMPGSSPKSVFQLIGAGQVGPGSLRGMPVLSRLVRAGFSVWPFHETSLPLVIEIWPRTFMGNVRKTVREERRQFLREHCPGIPSRARASAEDSDDAFDALVAALAMDRYREELRALERTDDPATRLEGAIWRPEAPVG